MVNGPDPTVSVSLAYFDGSASFSQTCFGTIGSSNPGFEACGAASVSSSVDASLAATLWTFSTSPPLAFWSAGLVLTALKVQATSSAVSGWLSDHFMPSLEVSHVSDSPGPGSLLTPYCTRFSYWNRRIPVLLARIARNGLKVSMSVAMATLTAGAASAACAGSVVPATAGAASATAATAKAAARRSRDRPDGVW